MKLLHHLYNALTDDWTPVMFGTMVVLAVLVARRPARLSTAAFVGSISIVLTFGWMLADSAMYPGDINQRRPSPFEALNKLISLLPVVIGICIKLIRTARQDLSLQSNKPGHQPASDIWSNSAGPRR